MQGKEGYQEIPGSEGEKSEEEENKRNWVTPPKEEDEKSTTTESEISIPISVGSESKKETEKKELKIPRTPSKRRYKRRSRRPIDDTRTSEGDLFEISPEFGKKKPKKKFRGKFKPVGAQHSPIGLPKSEEKREETELPLDEEIMCLVARTTIILPCTYRSLDSVHVGTLQWLATLTDRTLHTSRGNVPVWRQAEKLPKEIGDLSPLFQQVFGWKNNRGKEKIWSCHRLMLNKIIMEEIFSNPFLCTVQKGEQYPYEVEFESIELYLYPLGTALLAINVNWLPMSPKMSKHELSLHDMRTLLNISKYRHKIAEVCNGWGFTPPGESDLKLVNVSSEQKAELGEALYAARYWHETISLCTLGNWLLHLDGEDPSSPPLRLDYARHANHHTAVVIDRGPPQDILQSYLFHLRHAYGQKNRPPLNSNETLGRVLVWRLNRYIGLCKEGTVSLSWPIEGGEVFEVQNWHRKFLGVYLLLALHAHAEKWVLFELSDMAAAQAEKLKLESDNLNEIKNSRDQMRNLASLMVRYTLGMSSNDCGGTSEYSDFFTSLRLVFGIPELRDELSNELKDVLAVVESNYLEEERKQRDEQQANRRKAYDMQKILAQERAQQNDTFQILLSIIGSFTLPFVLVTGIWGMNITDLPDVDFYKLFGVTVGVSVFFLIGLLGLKYYWLRRSARRNMLKEITFENSGGFHHPIF